MGLLTRYRESRVEAHKRKMEASEKKLRQYQSLLNMRGQEDGRDHQKDGDSAGSIRSLAKEVAELRREIQTARALCPPSSKVQILDIADFGECYDGRRGLANLPRYNFNPLPDCDEPYEDALDDDDSVFTIRGRKTLTSIENTEESGNHRPIDKHQY